MDFVSFASAHGLIINNLVSGRITRCHTRTHRSKKNGAFFFAGSWGWCMDWSADNEPNIWQDKNADIPDIQKQIKESQKKYSQERAKLNADAANKAQVILNQCKQELSPYLAAKGFEDMCGNIIVEDDCIPVLVIPMYKDSKLVGCQKIYPDGEKKFLYGQILNDACFVIGNGKNVFFVEGYVSGLSLQKILQALKVSYKIYVCFSANNLLRFAKRLDGFVIADNDESGTGERVAIESCRNWWMSPNVGQDINDYHRTIGIFKASQELKNSIYRPAVA